MIGLPHALTAGGLLLALLYAYMFAVAPFELDDREVPVDRRYLGALALTLLTAALAAYRALEPGDA